MLAILAVALIGVSPLGLRVFGGQDGEWERLSFIGQTYGAVSALVAGLALVGVAVSLVFQARESRRAVDENRRQAMAELLRMAMEDPDLDECWGPIPEGDDPRARKQQLYTNMIVTQWGTAFRSGALPEARLHAIAKEMFSGPVGRAYWGAARERRLANPAGRAERRFNEILDSAYRSAAATASAAPRRDGREDAARRGPAAKPGAPAGPVCDGRSRVGGGRLLAAFAAGAAAVGGGVAVVRVLKARREPRRWWERAWRG
nr:DUF6082 family protein [Streptomonospora nanhaiensis]